ncbi:MAG TPA: SCP2 sterol-binding domain-containing protein [Steroidobacteraceae bacterium]|nr:SCP2 sterol-binding domain-containing protein [Steroidobacteraceae bacterium]
MTGILGNLLNRGLPRSGRARQLCAELAGRSLALEVRGFVTLRIESNGATLSVTESAADADARLEVGPLGLLALMGADAQQALQRGDANITGDAEIAAKFRELTRLLRPDPEEELSLVLGDVPAHQLGRLARGALEWGRGAARSAWRNGADYLAHERADLVPRREGEQFLRGVDALREDVDRAAARIELLTTRRAAARGGTRAP